MKSTKQLYKNVAIKLSDEQVKARSAEKLPIELHQVTVGQLLSDAHAERTSPTSNTRLTWSFGTEFVDYANFIAGLYTQYCNTNVFSVDTYAKAGGKRFKNFRLKTVMLKLFNVYHDMFYLVDTVTGKYTKIVPANIVDLMSPITLAHLIMGDGNYDAGRNRVRIYTNSYSLTDCILLASSITAMGIVTQVMTDKVDSKGNARHILTIGASQLDTLRKCVVPHMECSMLYRIGL